MKSDRGLKLLTPDQVCEIRNNPRGKKVRELAEEFGVTQGAISWVRTYRSYRNVVCN